MNGIKPIDTLYDGHYFRSRTEARWAVFFNALGIKYEYEPEGYKLEDGTCYLPDFWLPNVGNKYGEGTGAWFEVKGKEPTEKENIALASLSKMFGHARAFFGIGVPGAEVEEFTCPSGIKIMESWWVEKHNAAGLDGCITIDRCSRCGKVFFGFLDSELCKACEDSGKKGNSLFAHKAWKAARDRAAKKAIMARFEHGRKG